MGGGLPIVTTLGRRVGNRSVCRDCVVFTGGAAAHLSDKPLVAFYDTHGQIWGGAIHKYYIHKKLSLSTNMIEKISGIGGMKNLKILALGRNQIKSLSGIEAVADTLEELWISYNQLERLKGVGAMKKLRVLYMSNNNLKDWNELSRLQDCPALRDLLLIGNPIYDTELDMEVWRQHAINRLPQITQLDGIPVVRDSEQREEPIVENADGIANQN